MTLPRALTPMTLAVVLTLAGACRAGDHAMTEPVTDPASQDAEDGASSQAVLTIDDVMGVWRLRPISETGPQNPRGKRCLLMLGRSVLDPASNDGRHGASTEGCDGQLPEKAIAWRATPGGFELLGLSGVVLTMRQVGVDNFQSLDGRYRLDRAPMV